MKIFFAITISILLIMSGCTKEIPDQPLANNSPKTFLWLFPDSTIAEGHSRQHVRWWGEDADGFIVGYLFASGKFTPSDLQSHALDTLTWRWRTTNDSVIAFPLLTKRDTFEIVVRAVDNTFGLGLPDDALIRFVPAGAVPGVYTGAPFWDKNEDGQLDSVDQLLPNLWSAMDAKGATLGMPVLNQPPSVVFAQNPNDPSFVMQQPDTTFTAATFSWVGSDPDGDQTISSYDIVLNDTSNHSNYFTVPGNIKLVTLLAPRSRTNDIHGVQSVAADVWTGTFATNRRLIGSLPNLQLDTLNRFFIRARDVAGDASKFIRMPSDTTQKWFVKNPRGKLLIISDYITGDRVQALSFYKTVFPRVGFPEFEVIDIARGLTAQQKSDSKIGRLVPPFLDPAFIYTLQLFDIVFWYTDQFPSLAVAQVPLFQYLHDASHRGKVIFSTTFATSSDPRGAITDFSPLDSVSSVFLGNTRSFPTLGDTRVPGGFQLVPDSSDPSNIYPPLVFGNLDNPQLNQTIYSVFLRSIYKRADSKYVFHIQQDSRSPVRYTYLATLNDFRSVASISTMSWACGTSGTVFHSSDGGTTWTMQTTGTTGSLEAIQFMDESTGWSVGDNGVIIQTQDGGATWANRSVVTTENLLGVAFTSTTNGIIVGTNGLFIRTINAGQGWSSVGFHTNKNLHAVKFVDQQNGIVVGDSGLVVKTTDGGTTWRSIATLTGQKLFSVAYASSMNLLAVGSAIVNGDATIIKSIDGGDSWIQAASGTNVELHSIFADNTNAWACGAGGIVVRSLDGGNTWASSSTGVGQNLTGVSFSTPAQGIVVATGGVILKTSDGGSLWSLKPDGNINVGVIDGFGIDGKRSFLFLGLPLHYLDGAGGTVVPFLQHVIHDEFGG